MGRLLSPYLEGRNSDSLSLNEKTWLASVREEILYEDDYLKEALETVEQHIVASLADAVRSCQWSDILTNPSTDKAKALFDNDKTTVILRMSDDAEEILGDLLLPLVGFTNQLTISVGRTADDTVFVFWKDGADPPPISHTIIDIASKTSETSVITLRGRTFMVGQPKPLVFYPEKLRLQINQSLVLDSLSISMAAVGRLWQWARHIQLKGCSFLEDDNAVTFVETLGHPESYRMSTLEFCDRFPFGEPTVLGLFQRVLEKKKPNIICGIKTTQALLKMQEVVDQLQGRGALLIPPSSLDFISFSYGELDECAQHLFQSFIAGVYKAYLQTSMDPLDFDSNKSIVLDTLEGDVAWPFAIRNAGDLASKVIEIVRSIEFEGSNGKFNPVTFDIC